jgi:hypothetical protein
MEEQRKLFASMAEASAASGAVIAAGSDAASAVVMGDDVEDTWEEIDDERLGGELARHVGDSGFVCASVSVPVSVWRRCLCRCWCRCRCQ